MANMIKTTDYSKNQKQILIGQESYYIGLPVRVSGTAGATMLAGQPLVGDITARDTAFTASTKDGSSNKYAANGILLHDVVLDSDGKGNGTLILAGCIDMLKLDSTIQTIMPNVTGVDRIIFVKGSAY